MRLGVERFSEFTDCTVITFVSFTSALKIMASKDYVLLKPCDRNDSLVHAYANVCKTLGGQHFNGDLFFFGGQPISMMQESLRHITERHPLDDSFIYTVTPKLDGERMLFIKSRDRIAFVNRALDFFVPTQQCVDVSHRVNNTVNAPNVQIECVLDGEMFGKVYFVFDIIFLLETFDVHLLLFNERIALLNRYLLNERCLLEEIFRNHQLVVIMKEHYSLESFKGTSSNLYEAVESRFVDTYTTRLGLGSFLPPESYRFDGLIFTPKFGGYVVGTNWKCPGNILYKWKPKRSETIDFQVPVPVPVGESATALVDNMAPFKINGGTKMCTVWNIGSPTNLDCTSLMNLPLEPGKVYECQYLDQLRFIPIRLREDKKRPNSFIGAMTSWKLIAREWDIDVILPMINGSGARQSFQTSWQNSMEKMISERTLLRSDDSVISRYLRQRSSVPDNKNSKIEFEVRIQNGKNNVQGVSRRHFWWLVKTLDHLGTQCAEFSETLDVFDSPTETRTTYFVSGGNPSAFFQLHPPLSVSKKSLDLRDYTETLEAFGYAFRIAISMEKKLDHMSGIHAPLVPKPTDFQRSKRRWSYQMTSEWRLDLTEFRDNRKQSKKPGYQVEIEYCGSCVDSETHNEAATLLFVSSLQDILAFVLVNLCGRSEVL